MSKLIISKIALLYNLVDSSFIRFISFILIAIFLFLSFSDIKIFPLVEIILLYFLIKNYNIGYAYVIAISFITDYASFASFGTNLLYMTASYFFCILVKEKIFIKITIKYYLINFFYFSSYAFVAVFFKYFLFLRDVENIYLVDILFLYFTTILSYPLLNILMQKAFLVLSS